MPREKKGLSRRQLLSGAAALAGGVALASCGRDRSSPGAGGAAPLPGPAAGDGPEVRDLRFGIIALTDCSPIVIAHERGLFAKHGIRSTIVKGASWAAIRDSLSNGDLHASHILLGMPFASTLGLFGAAKKPMVIPWILNRNGQAITLKAELKGKVAKDPKALLPFVRAAKAAGRPMRFAMTFPPGTHAMWLRYFLGAGGIDPDKDVALITVPPAQMVANMKVGAMDGYCVGEPWNARAIADGIGYTAITTQEIWKDHPEKACAFTEEFAEKNPKTVKAVLRALHEASVWLDDLGNRPEQAEIVSRPTYINCTKELILGRLLGKYDYGDGRKKQDPDYMIFSQRGCNYPQPKFGAFWLSQLRRWGMVEGTPDYAGISKRVMRADLYEDAMKEIGFSHGGASTSVETLFDGVKFDPAAPEAFAMAPAIKCPKEVG